MWFHRVLFLGSMRVSRSGCDRKNSGDKMYRGEGGWLQKYTRPPGKCTSVVWAEAARRFVGLETRDDESLLCWLAPAIWAKIGTDTTETRHVGIRE